jgi:hypothetical protein
MGLSHIFFCMLLLLTALVEMLYYKDHIHKFIKIYIYV